ncbi:MAG: DNA mismatch repair protein MutS, partial [Lachnospiraceae bacterium]|nr:DNA mismatch repair protein MutS [Lachnospiraceae bacterium]
MNHSFQTLEFTQILDKLEAYAYTKSAKEEVRQLKPYLSKREVEHAQKETTEARIIIDSFGEPPIVSLHNVNELVINAAQGTCLSAEQLEYLGITFTAVKRMKDFLSRCKILEIGLPYYETELNALEQLREELSQKIRGARVDDYASKLLKDLRNTIERLDDKMRAKAELILKNSKAYLSDSFVTIRNGRLCVPVKKEYKFQIAGSVIDKSSTGMTVFIEPAAVAKISEELQIVKIDADNEERRILYELTDLVAKEREVIEHNQRTLEKIDFLFAKGKLSAQCEGKQPQINNQRHISIKRGRHPLMAKEICVPLDFEIGKEASGIIITGPNTGGKTVAIKTVGLHSLMAQSGLHVPCEEGDFCMNNQVLCDIGDGQNIAENLSTFSSHIMNTLDILKIANEDTLVIMDELGSGTDPTEGMGIAIAILEELRKSKALFLVTTHYPEV